jgi:hypothetical protein
VVTDGIVGFTPSAGDHRVDAVPSNIELSDAAALVQKNNFKRGVVAFRHELRANYRGYFLDDFFVLSKVELCLEL